MLDLLWFFLWVLAINCLVVFVFQQVVEFVALVSNANVYMQALRLSNSATADQVKSFNQCYHRYKLVDAGILMVAEGGRLSRFEQLWRIDRRPYVILGVEI